MRNKTVIAAMTKAKSILVVIDPTAARQPALERAARIAPRLGLGLHLLICIHEDLPGRRLAADEVRNWRAALLNHQLGYLKTLARGYPQLEISTRVVWDRPLHESIIRETLRCEPRMVMKDTHFHAPLARALFTPADWHLIRDCPAPLWLVRDQAWPEQPVISAFVDPMHENDKPADLDHRILAEATVLAERLDGAAHAVHCFHAPLPTAGIPVAAGQVTAMMHEIEQEHAARLAELALAHHLGPPRTQLRSGQPTQAIPQAAQELQASLAVMGAVARSRLQQAFVGSTAERVLENLPCDVLIIKPPRFESPVTYRAQAADFAEVH